MVEEIVGVFNVRQLMLEEYGTTRSCTLFLTNERVVVMVPEGIALRMVALPIIALVAGFIGFLTRNPILFFTGMGVGVGSGIVLGMLDFLIRHRKVRKVKQLPPAEILRVGKQNFEIPFSKTTRVQLRWFEELQKGSFLLPTLPKYNYEVEFVVENGKYVFIIDSDMLNQFTKKLRPFIPEIVEIKKE